MKKLVFALVLSVVAATTFAGTYYAAPVALGDGDGRDPENACTLLTAVDKVNADQGGEIILANGTYQEDASSAGVSKRVYNSNTASYYVLGASGENYPITVRSASGDPADVTIKGQYYDNAKAIRLFLVYGNAVRISDVTICEGYSDTTAHGGGAVLGATAEAVGSVVDNCILERNKAIIGSAVRAVTVVNSLLRGNEAGGGNSGSGGAIYGSGDVSNCTFFANRTLSDRGSSSCIYGDSYNQVVDSRFLYNTNGGWCNYCGAVCGVTNLLRCTFVGNYNSGNNGSAAACLRSVPFVTDCSFTNQNAGSGFAIGTGGRYSGCDFYQMSSGGYALNAPVSISNCTFKFWRASRALIGGNASGLEVEDSHFSFCSNVAGTASFPVSCINGAARVERCDFTRNFAQTYGGALGSVTSVIDCGFTNNVIANAYGSSCYCCENVIGCSVLGETAVSGVFYQPGLVSNCTFTACKVTGRTSGTVYGKSGTRIYGSTFLCCTNEAYVGGGAVVDNVDVFDGCTVAGCSSSYHCPVRGVKKAVVNCIFTNNLSSYAGVVSGAAGSVMTNCLVAYNNTSSAYQDAGIVAGFSNIVNCTVISNTLPKKVGVSGGTAYNSIIVGNAPNDVSGVQLVSSLWTLPSSYASADANSRCLDYAAVRFRGKNDKGVPELSPKPSSPARHGGRTLPTQWHERDLAGNPRVEEGQNVDIGAYAYVSPSGLMLLVR